MSFRKSHIKPKIKGIGRKKIIQRPLFWITLFILVIVILFTYLILFSSYFQLSHIKVSGYKNVDNAKIEEIVWNDSYNKFFSAGLINFASRSIFIVNTNQIANSIKTKYPIIKDIKIKKSLPNIIDLTLEEREPFAVFCQNSNSDCFTIDEDGVIFEKLQGVLNETMILNKAEDKEISLGSQAVLKDTINKISKIKDNLKNNFQIDIKEVAISNILVVKTFEDWKIYFDSNSDIDFQITKMNSLLNSEITPKERKNLQYVYLQYKDKAYYK